MTEEQTALIHGAIERLRRLTELFQKRREQLAIGVGITEHQWGVLEEISSDHFMPSMFARQRESSPAAVSKTIRQLIDKGLVAVSVNKEDARQRNYDLTSKGEAVLARLRERRQEAIDRVWKRFGSDHLRAFVGFADELEVGLTQLLSSSTRRGGHRSVQRDVEPQKR